MLKARSGVEVRKWDVNFEFTDVTEMKRRLVNDVCDCLDGEELTFGYLEPGHGTKGRQVPLLNSGDLSSMYSTHRRRKQIILWVKISKKKTVPPPAKRQCTSSVSELSSKTSNKTSSAPSSSKYTAQQQKMTELEVIVDDLSERHGDAYTTEQV